MQIVVSPNHFTTPEEARQEIYEQGLHLCEMAVPPVNNESHWHRFSTQIYILDGELRITDSARGEVLVAGPRSRVTVPERVLHSEFSEVGYSILAGMSVNPASLTESVDLDPSLLENE